jgi:dsRNA-specific ribonuclease
LEALEFLGDSFLKYALSCILFLEPAKHSDGALNNERTLRRSNTKLFWLARRRGLASHYIQNCQFDAKDWLALVMLDRKQIQHKSISNENHNVIELNQSNVVDVFGNSHRKCRHLESNTLADVLEALTGAYLVKGGQTKVMEFMARA